MKHPKHRNTRQALSALALMAAGLHATTAQAATINVSATGTVGVVAATNGDGQCSLIGAIINANADNASGDSDCAAGSGADTIVLPTGATFTLTSINFNLTGANGLPNFTTSITIEGNGSTITRSTAGGTPDFRLIRASTGSLTLNRITLSNGVATQQGGGAILAAGGSLTINQSTLRGNNAGTDGFGGAIYGFNTSTITLSNSTLSGNSASEGGGLWTAGGTSLNNVTITGNTASVLAGGWYTEGVATVRNSLIAGNSASVEVSEVFNLGNLILSGGNLFGHSALNSQQAFFFVSFLTGNFNATSDGNTPTALASILNSTLANNGGPTQTHALVSGSPAVNAAGAGATETDQRAFAAAGVRDIGAFELNGVDPNAVVVVNGACGTASGKASATAPEGAALCTTGTATAVTGNSTAWTWGCNGTGDGTSTAVDACVASYPKPILTINASPLTIAIDASSTVTASSDNGLAPVLSNVSTPTSVCSLGSSSGSINVTASATGTAAGTCTIAANQAAVTTGTTRYLAADQKMVGITVDKKAQTINGLTASPSTIFVGEFSGLSATASSGLTVSYSTSPSSVCTNNGSSVTGVGAGTCTVTASQAGDDSFAAAPNAMTTITVNAVPVNGLCGSAKTTNPTANMPSGSSLCSAGVASLVTGTSGVWAWSCNGTNGGSSDTTCSAPYGTQTLSISATPGMIPVGGTSTILASSNAGLAVTLATTSPACTLSGTTATGVAEGSCVVTASQPGTGDSGNPRYVAASSVSTTVTVNPAGPPPSACDAFATGSNVNVIDLRSSPGGQTARGVNGRFNVIYGSDLADTLTGGNAGNCIDGGAGADRLTAGAGDNSLYGGMGNDTLTPGSGNTLMDGGAGTDRCGRVSGRATASYTSCELN